MLSIFKSDPLLLISSLSRKRHATKMTKMGQVMSDISCNIISCSLVNIREVVTGGS